jgi:hypothetical protein
MVSFSPKIISASEAAEKQVEFFGEASDCLDAIPMQPNRMRKEVSFIFYAARELLARAFSELQEVKSEHMTDEKLYHWPTKVDICHLRGLALEVREEWQQKTGLKILDGDEELLWADEVITEADELLQDARMRMAA